MSTWLEDNSHSFGRLIVALRDQTKALGGLHSCRTMGSMKKQKLHVLAMPFPAQSHMSAMMHLCKRIAAEHDVIVSYVTVDSMYEQMQEHWVAPKGLDIRLESIPFEWKMPNGFDAYCAANKGRFVDMEDKHSTGELGKLVDRLATEVAPVCCIVSDYFVPFTQHVATEFGIPRVVLWPGCAGWTSIEFHLPELLARSHIFLHKGSEDNIQDCWVDYVHGLTPILRSDLPAYLQVNDDQLWMEHSMKRSPGIREASWVLVNSFYELEREVFGFMREELGEKFVPVGPLFLLGESEGGPANVVLRAEDENCIQWLDKQSKGSVLYISFGSITVLTLQQFQELAQALEECKQPFLWVIRSELVIGGIPAESYLGFCERTKEQGLVISWAPQLRVLAHPSVAGFLTHCGWNSMLESMCNGVPMLGWPWAGEQNTNCKFMADDWGIGTRFRKGKNGMIDKEEILRVIKQVMKDDEGKEMRLKVEKLKDAGEEAVKQGRSNLHALLQELRGLPIMA